MPTRKEIQDVYVRICRDSGFKMEATKAAVWSAMPHMEVMEQIAAGTHPAAR